MRPKTVPIFPDGVEPSEVLVVLSDYFKSSHGEGRTTSYPNADPQLRVTVTKSGRLIAERGPYFGRLDVEHLRHRIAEAVRPGTRPGYDRQLFFTMPPVTGSFRSTSGLHLVPIPNDTPVPLGTPSPVILELPFMEGDDAGINAIRHWRLFDEWHAFLSLILADPILNRQAWDRRWNQVPALREQAGRSSPEHLMPGFRWRDSEALPDARPIDLQAPEIYYTMKRHLRSGFTLPDHFDWLVTAFASLTGQVRTAVIDAGRWRAVGQELRLENRTTLAHISNVAAIEALANVGHPPSVCACCQQLIHKPTSRFKEFLERFTGFQDKAILEDIYRLRSRIHGGRLAEPDLYLLGTHGPQSLIHTNLTFVLEQLVAIAAVNWLVEVVGKDA